MNKISKNKDSRVTEVKMFEYWQLVKYMKYVLENTGKK